MKQQRVTRTAVENALVRMIDIDRFDADVATHARLHCAIVAQLVIDCVDQKRVVRDPARYDLFQRDEPPASAELLGLDIECLREVGQRVIEHCEAAKEAA